MGRAFTAFTMSQWMIVPSARSMTQRWWTNDNGIAALFNPQSSMQSNVVSHRQAFACPQRTQWRAPRVGSSRNLVPPVAILLAVLFPLRQGNYIAWTGCSTDPKAGKSALSCQWPCKMTRHLRSTYRGAVFLLASYLARRS